VVEKRFLGLIVPRFSGEFHKLPELHFVTRRCALQPLASHPRNEIGVLRTGNYLFHPKSLMAAWKAITTTPMSVPIHIRVAIGQKRSSSRFSDMTSRATLA
jgi:hypothetical protein